MFWPNLFNQGGDAEANLKKSVEEIRKLNQEISAARQDNLALKVLIKFLEQTLYFIYNTARLFGNELWQ